MNNLGRWAVLGAVVIAAMFAPQPAESQASAISQFAKAQVPPPPPAGQDVTEHAQTLAWNAILNMIKVWDGSPMQAELIRQAIQNHIQTWYVESPDPRTQQYAAYWAHHLPFWQQNLNAFMDWLRTRQERMLANGEMPGQWEWNNAGVAISMADGSAQDHRLNTQINLALARGHALGTFSLPLNAIQLENELAGGGSPTTIPRFRVHITHLDLGNGMKRGYVEIIDRKLGVTVSSWYIDYPANNHAAAQAVGISFARTIEDEIEKYLKKEKVEKAGEKPKKAG